MNRKLSRNISRYLLLTLVSLSLLLGLMASVSLAADTTTYIIRSGENLRSIAEAHDTTVEELMALNPIIANANVIYVGIAIQVPTTAEDPGSTTAICPRPYTAVTGDTWASIAAAHSVDAGILATVNNAQVGNAIAVGTDICVPAAMAMPATPTPIATAAPTQAPATPATPDQDQAMSNQDQYYVVQRGDYLSRIAIRFGCTTQVLAHVNGIADPSRIHTGLRLLIPADCGSVRVPAPTPSPVTPAPVAPPPPAAPTPAPVVPQPPAPAPAPGFPYQGQGPWTGEYFNNRDVAGSPSATRQDNQLAFLWGEASPAPGINGDGFSARWTGTFYFTGDEYRFAALADDGVRVWIDDRLLINGWQDQSQSLYYKNYTPSRGNHTIRVEYYDARLSATIVVNWAPTR